jgi:hypothetical protein
MDDLKQGIDKRSKPLFNCYDINQVFFVHINLTLSFAPATVIAFV